MTKAALCVHCTDIVAPYRDWQTNRAWRWCQCTHMGVRWRDGHRGLLEVTALYGPDDVRVLGFSNMFLTAAAGVDSDVRRKPEQWRDLHDSTCSTVESNYLFHVSERNCWALVVRVGETGDVFFLDWEPAWLGGEPTISR